MKDLTMNITKEELQRKFNQYNNLYFEGKLGPCRFYFLSRNCGIIGKYIDPLKSNGERESRIGINKYAITSDESLRNVLVHEMVHMYVYTIEGVKFDGLFGHGFRFRRHKRRIKRDFDFTI